MGLLAAKETFINEWHDSFLAETKRTGYVCTFEIEGKIHRFYGLNDIEQLLKEANSQKLDTYISLNGFEYGTRTAKGLRQIRNVGIDLDCYKIGFAVEVALKHIQTLIEKGLIPVPNLVILSGRGIQLIYSISGGASPKMAFLTQYITIQFISTLKELGADTNAADVTRVFRLPYSINSKNNEQVQVSIWRSLEYSLEDLYSYVTPLEKPRKRRKQGKQQGQQKPKSVTLLNYRNGAKTLYTLNQKRLSDLERLVEVRGGDLTGCRNTFLYIYCFTATLYTKSKEDTYYFANEVLGRIFSRTEKPMTAAEVKATVTSAAADAMEFFEAYAKNDFTMKGLPRTLVKPMKNSTVIEKLGITHEEQKLMETVISGLEKQHRNTVYQREKRGSVTRDEYLGAQKEQTEDKLWQLEQAIKRNPTATQRELAVYLGWSAMTVNRHMKRLK